jgi:hypothetical protein
MQFPFYLQGVIEPAMLGRCGVVIQCCQHGNGWLFPPKNPRFYQQLLRQGRNGCYHNATINCQYIAKLHRDINKCQFAGCGRVFHSRIRYTYCSRECAFAASSSSASSSSSSATTTTTEVHDVEDPGSDTDVNNLITITVTEAPEVSGPVVKYKSLAPLPETMSPAEASGIVTPNGKSVFQVVKCGFCALALPFTELRPMVVVKAMKAGPDYVYLYQHIVVCSKCVDECNIGLCDECYCTFTKYVAEGSLKFCSGNCRDRFRQHLSVH